MSPWGHPDQEEDTCRKDTPIAAQNKPCAVEVEAGKTYLRDSRSGNPFCDGSHKQTTLTPVKFVAEETRRVFLCGCKKTANAPYCDGTHKSV